MPKDVVVVVRLDDKPKEAQGGLIFCLSAPRAKRL